MNDLITIDMLARDIIRMLHYFRSTPNLTLFKGDVVNFENKTVLIKEKKIPIKALTGTLDDVSECYLMPVAYRLSLLLAELSPIYTFMLPLKDDDSCRVSYNGIAMRLSKKEDDYIFEICCGSIGEA